MSASTTARPLTGWGRTAPSVAEVLSTSDPTQIVEAVMDLTGNPEKKGELKHV